ncbi:hypothetical protein C882_4486 [Caenispirillum salinarum AK4]|uniref:DUF883 domain-containing protein n=1 Tax=Caenispirillum salinarum AK4 TaxID=1238182 RepID=K9GYZ9_9PROT|nr:DUF883 family protein [Caenispirillum salinarum]EKV30527.1 hypothetical protein C882_4486 [Caenispirillum salinarum AK4]
MAEANQPAAAQGATEGTARARAESDVDRLKSDMDALRKDFAALTESLKDVSTARGRSYAERARATADDYQHRAQATAEEYQARARAGLEQAQATIEERPMTSVLVAFGIGLLLGKILDRD